MHARHDRRPRVPSDYRTRAIRGAPDDPAVSVQSPLSTLLRAAIAVAALSARNLTDLIVPDLCGACGREGSLLCDGCRRRFLDARAPLADPPPPLAAAATLGRYDTELGAALRTLKFHATPRLAQPLGAALAPVVDTVAAALGAPAPLLVATPTDPERRRSRGFDHAALLADAAARAGGYPVAPLLERTRGVPPLHELGRAERHRALERAIAVRRGVAVPATVILVDDIWTSGATFGASARALMAAGCRRVGAVAVAREPLR